VTDEKPGPYVAYMLRLWQVDGKMGPVWRASLESPHTGERHAFADLPALLAFLEVRTRSAPHRTSEEGEMS
jgi:hypothetical protein